MKQNSAEQPYEAYERLKKELDEINLYIKLLANLYRNDQRWGFKMLFFYNKYNSPPKHLIPSLIESAESKKQQIENELNNLLNGN
jgi:hypothetical protein